MLFSQSYGVFSNNGLAGRRVRSDKNGITHFQVIDGLFLECIKLKGVLNVRQRCNGTTLSNKLYVPCQATIRENS